jgi:BirA family biotin operon repressor/biotin-[acetyl-CoA-carboxylase] ligase
LILRPKIRAADSTIITLAAAVAVAETLKLDFDVAADIKWPNDVLASGRKICGILIEAVIDGDRLQYAVMGIGVNVAERSFSSELAGTATSLFLETGNATSPEDMIEPLLARLERWYAVATSKPNEVIVRWEELSSYARGCAVRIESTEGPINGITCGLASNCALILELPDGEKREILSGEVRLRAVGALK